MVARSDGRRGIDRHLDVRRKVKETNADYASRVHIEFVRNRRSREKAKTPERQGFYSTTFESWRKRVELGKDSDEEDYAPLSACNLEPQQESRSGKNVQDMHAEETVDRQLELELWQELRNSKQAVEGDFGISDCSESGDEEIDFSLDDGGGVLDSGGHAVGRHNADPIAALPGSNAIAASESQRGGGHLCMTVKSSGSTFNSNATSPNRPHSAGAVRCAAANPGVAKSWTPGILKPRVLLAKPIDSRGSARQLRGLATAYSTASASKLHTAVSHALATDHIQASESEKIGGRRKVRAGGGSGLLGRSVQGKGAEGRAGETAKRMETAVKFLRQRGLVLSTLASGDNVPRGSGARDWMRQLAEEYPDELCKVTQSGMKDFMLVGHEGGVCSHHPKEARADALIDSRLWVLNPNGHPNDSAEWTSREAWLSPTGRLWIAPDSEQMIGHSPCLYLGGKRVAELSVTQVSRGWDTVSSLDGKPIYPFSVELPRGRLGCTRNKYFAAEDRETCEKWVRACQTLMLSPIHHDADT